MTPRDTIEGSGRPSPAAGFTSLALVVVSVVIAALVDLGDGFTPRVETIDALAGLAIGALIVDRLLTFWPPLAADKDPAQRAIDLTVLRLGYGAVLAAAFVVLTDLRAVEALTGDPVAIAAGVDRGIAVLALAAGVAGLARILGAINPQPATDGSKDPKTDGNADQDGGTIAPPAVGARILGLVLVGIGALVALTALNDDEGLELLGPEEVVDGTVAFVVRFGPVLLAAAIVQQLTDFVGRALGVAKNNVPVIVGGLAVAVGVIAARVFDLYLLHNIGFFGAGDMPLADALAESSNLALWGDAFLTGVAIAAGTKPLHDFASRLRKAKRP